MFQILRFPVQLQVARAVPSGENRTSVICILLFRGHRVRDSGSGILAGTIQIQTFKNCIYRSMVSNCAHSDVSTPSIMTSQPKRESAKEIMVAVMLLSFRILLEL